LIFGDSSFFVGISDSRDQWHARAARLRDNLPKQLVVSDLVVAESVTIVGSRAGGRAGRTLYEFFLDSCDIEFLDHRGLDDAMALYVRFDGKLSVADCASVTIMSRRKIRRIVSFDSDFDRVDGIERIS
jgi:predicted nucleic acid-binding protein